jgi:predicted HD phosphohydrolase
MSRTPLLKPEWRYVSHFALERMTADDWRTLDAQRAIYRGELQAEQVLRLLRVQQDDPSFGYPISNYGHCLQSATLAYRDGQDEETVVVALLHDIGFDACPPLHGAFAGALLGAFVSERHVWMLEHHQAFQDHHVGEHYDAAIDRNARERWRGHPHFDWTATFVARYDQAAMDPDYENRPLGHFEPMVRRVFARPYRSLTDRPGETP